MADTRKALDIVEAVVFLGGTIGMTASLLTVITSYWVEAVNATVPEPYMDEIFHIPQAQAYCNGNFQRWDPNITTPPGLYVQAWLAHQMGWPCTSASLRKQNSLLLHSFTFVLLFLMKTPNFEKTMPAASDSVRLRSILRDVHTAFNACLFPLLFFFSALYYTDGISTLVALLALGNKLTLRENLGQTGLGLFGLLAGLCALLCRQTNIFWVSVFTSGLIVVDLLESSQKARGASWEARSPTVSTVCYESWSNGLVYDVSIEDAFFEDYIKTTLSLAVASISNIHAVLLSIIPQVMLVATFGAFVAWNGGVVLGDKSNHVATIHIPQMLYLWPFIAFFSAPLIYPHVLHLLLPKRLVPSFVQGFIPLNSHSTFPKPIVLIFWLCFAVAAVHFNTIVHPFLLADNRHYTFYVFRYLNLYPATKYLVTPIYILCGWTVLQTLAAPRNKTFDNAPTTTKSQSSKKKPTPNPAQQQTPTVEAATSPTTDPKGATQSNTTSFALIWLATTALCIVSTPLVEPRYFIVPWLTWRLRVPSPRAAPVSTPYAGSSASMAAKAKYFARLFNHGDHRLWLETVWLLALNAGLGYVFLKRGFAWESQPGIVQRFVF